MPSFNRCSDIRKGISFICFVRNSSKLLYDMPYFAFISEKKETSQIYLHKKHILSEIDGHEQTDRTDRYPVRSRTW